MTKYFSAYSTLSSNQKIGVLLINLGTPQAPTTRAVRTYLAEFLADPRVVELTRWVWLPILHGIILNTRPRNSAEAYQKVWTTEGSPLLVHLQQQKNLLQQALDAAIAQGFQVEIGMRYGEPSIPLALQALANNAIRKILVLPLYPQYSASTTASTFDALAQELKYWREIPELRMVTQYYQEDGYIEALAISITDFWNSHGRAEKLIISFHGIPKDYADAGDPYKTQCEQTALRLAARLELKPDDWQHCFQSRFGPREWLKPYADETLQILGSAGVKSVDLIAPGFSSDCLETLEEIKLRMAETFTHAGGKTLNYIPALNERPAHIEFLKTLVQRHCQEW